MSACEYLVECKKSIKSEPSDSPRRYQIGTVTVRHQAGAISENSATVPKGYRDGSESVLENDFCGPHPASKTHKPAPAMPCLNRKLAHRGAGLVDRPRIMRRSLELADNAAIIEGQFSGIILQGENRSRMGFLSRLGLYSGHICPFTSNKRPIIAYFIPYNLGVE
jgi:hypothetical protein